MTKGPGLSQKLFELVAMSCGVSAENLRAETLVDDIGLDSLSLTQVVTALEVDLGVEFNDAELTGLLEARNLGDYLLLLDGAVARSHGRLAAI